MKTKKIKFTENDVVLSLWETCERLRAKNNTIHVVAKKSLQINAGDCLYYNKGGKGLSCWFVDEIKEVKDSRLKNKKIWILKTSYKKIVKSNEKNQFFSGG